jgi:prepilin-type N-terminal cleavage/methylation domain-containing protein
MISLKNKASKGFTIVELLIVIVVIGILAALVVTTYNGIQQKARDTERKTD